MNTKRDDSWIERPEVASNAEPRFGSDLIAEALRAGLKPKTEP